MALKINLGNILSRLEQVDTVTWKIPKMKPMKVDGIFFATKPLLDAIIKDQSLLQVANVATLPGISKHSLAMPDLHWGYGFPIGGVAAFDTRSGIISPGGVGYDINCGVRLLKSNLVHDEIKPYLDRLVAKILKNIPCGIGSKRKDLHLYYKDLDHVLSEGASWAIKNGYGYYDDLSSIEDGGKMNIANPDTVSLKAKERGINQLGTLGSGNHFIEIGIVDELFDKRLADILGLFPSQVTVTIHTGSRGLGYQVCDEAIVKMRTASVKYGIDLPDPQLCCAPLSSPEGQEYLKAMSAAANFAFANRQLITHWIRQTFVDVMHKKESDMNLKVVYDVVHNIAKIEKHIVDGENISLCVHRKGATRSFGPFHKDLPEKYRAVGQPVLIPGDMGRYSYVLVGTTTAMDKTFGSTCHGAGRILSRHQARKNAKGRLITNELKKKGIIIAAASKRTLLEEIPEAYKDVSQVVEAVIRAGLNQKVARLRPLGVVKG